MVKDKSKEIEISFGEQLIKLRKAKGLSLDEAAKRIKIGKTTLWDYEHDKYQNPSISVLKKMSKEYDFDVVNAFLERKIVLDISQYSPVGTQKVLAIHIAEKEKLYNKKENNDE